MREAVGVDRPCVAVVVAYRSVDALRRALAPVRLPGVVIDNSSCPEVAAATHEAGWDYVDPGANLGFAAGVNRGIGWSRERYQPAPDVLLINPDAVIADRDVMELHRTLVEDPRCAAVAPSLVSPKGVSEPTTWPVPTPISTLRNAVGLAPTRTSWFLNGAVLMLKASALQAVGEFDERFFLYSEECDWQVRAQRQGWTVRHVETAWAEHVGGGTSTDARRRLRHFHSSAELYARKWHGRWGWQLWRLAATLAAVRRSFTRDASRRSEQLYVLSLLLRGPSQVLRQER